MKVYCNYTDDSFDDMSTIDFKDIKRDKLKSFAIFRDNDTPIFELFYEQGQKPIYRRRYINNGTGNDNQIVYIIGWQKTINGENIQSINYITDNVVIQHGKFRGDGIFMQPQWHKYEDSNSTCDCVQCR